jgi:hypothetical protein
MWGFIAVLSEMEKPVPLKPNPPHRPLDEVYAERHAAWRKQQDRRQRRKRLLGF